MGACAPPLEAVAGRVVGVADVVAGRAGVVVTVLAVVVTAGADTVAGVREGVLEEPVSRLAL